MKETIYLEVDEEITAVIERIKSSQESCLVVVIPRGSALAQSIVNLKLLKRSAEGYKKSFVFVSADKTTKNLASQLNIKVFDKVEAAEAFDFPEAADDSGDEDYDSLPFEIETYRRYDQREQVADREVQDHDDEVDSEDIEGEEDTEEDVPRDNLSSDDDGGDETNGELSSEEEIVDDEPEVKETFTEDEREGQQKPEGAPNNGRSKVLAPKRGDFSPKKKRILLVSLASLLVIALVFSGLYLPKANILAVVKTEDIEKEYEVLLKRDEQEVSLEGMTVPAKLLNVDAELSKDFTTTGKKDVGEKAKGTITIYNNWDINDQTIPEGSRFVANSKVFLSTKEVRVPGASITISQGEIKKTPGSIKVNVEAETNGEDYNIGASSFVIASLPANMQKDITGKSDEAMSGGISREVKVVDAADLVKAEKEIKEEVLALARESIKDKAKKDKLTTLENVISQEVVSLTFSHKESEEAEKFEVSISTKAFTLGFSQDDVKEVVLETAEKEIGVEKMILNKDDLEISYESQESNIDDGFIRIKTNFAAKIAKNIDETGLARSIRNKSFDAAEKYLESLSDIESYSLNTWPSFYKRTPFLNSRIKINYDYDQQAETEEIE